MRFPDMGATRWGTAVAALCGVLLAFALVVITVNTIQFAGEHDRQELLACLRGNETRKAIVDAFDAYTEALIAAGERDRTPSEEQARDERIAAFRTDVAERLEPLGPRDCEERK